MGCTRALDFESPPLTGAHLSFYWTMDDSGSGNCADSTVGLVWPMEAGTSSAPGLFNAGVEVNHRIRGLSLTNSPSIVITQATSQGVSYWFWVKIVAYGTIPLLCDLLDFAGGNFDFLLTLTSVDGATTTLDLLHQKDNTHFVEITSPNLSWSLGTWHMVACTYDKVAQTLNIYADGVLVQTAADVLVYPDLVSSLWTIGIENPGAGTLPDIIFDELGLCIPGGSETAALTQSQVTALFNSNNGVTWPGVKSIVSYP